MKLISSECFVVHSRCRYENFFRSTVKFKEYLRDRGTNIKFSSKILLYFKGNMVVYQRLSDWRRVYSRAESSLCEKKSCNLFKGWNTRDNFSSISIISCGWLARMRYQYSNKFLEYFPHDILFAVLCPLAFMTTLDTWVFVQQSFNL